MPRGMSFGREFLLAAACSRWPTRTAAILDAVRGPIDWQRFLHVVRRQRVSGLVNHGLIDATSQTPAWVRNEIARDAMTMACRNLVMVAETARLQRLFSAAKLSVTFLKGMPLAMTAFNNIALRHAKDIDVLVSPSSVAAAADVVDAAGYGRVLPPPEMLGSHVATWVQEFQHFSYRHRGNGVEVELHWRLFRNRYLARVPTPNEDAGVRLPGGTEVHTLCRPDLFTYLCAHGAIHGWLRLKWLADIGALLAQGSERDTERLFEAASARGAALVAGQAILLSHRILETPISSRLLGRLRANRRVQTLEARALTMMVGPHFEAEPEEWPLRTRLQFSRNALDLGNWRFLAAGVRVHLVLEGDVCALPLPRHAAFLYPIVRGPFWAWRRIRGMSPRRRLLATSHGVNAAPYPE